MQQFITVNDTTCIKSAELRTWQKHFSCDEPSSGQQQKEFLVHSMIVLSMGI